MGTSPVFSEVIGISFDVNSFAESIKQLQQMWQDALGQMSGKSPALGIGNLDGVTAALSKIAGDVTNLGTSYSAALDEVFNKINVKVEDSAKKVKYELKKVAADTLSELADQVERGGETEAIFQGALKDYLTRGLNPSQLTTRGQQLTHDAIKEGAAGIDFDALTAKQREWYVNYEQVLAQAEDRMVEFSSKQVEVAEAAWQKMGVLQSQAMKEDEARTAAKQRALEQEEASVQRMGVLQSQAAREDETREAARARALEQEEAAQQRMGVLQAQAAKEDEARTEAKQRAAQRQEADAQRMGVLQTQAMREDEARAEAQEQAIRRIGVLQEAAYKEDQARTEAKLRALQKEEEAIQRMGRLQAAAIAEDKKRTEQKNKQGSLTGSFSSAFAENFSAESLGNFAGMSVAFGLIGTAIGAVYESMSKVVELFKSGWEYAEDMQEATAKLQGVIASSVTLSKDFATNYQMAGEAAQNLHQKFQDAAIQYGTTNEILERGFKQFVDGGGVSMVRNLGEAADVAIKLGVALQAAGKDADTSRAIMSELPKLLEGTAKPSSFILETLGITADKWKQIVASAKVHHDLLDQLAPLMANYTKVAEDAANRTRALEESIGLQVKRIMADGERDAFAGWANALKGVKTFLDENRTQITTIVAEVSSLGAEFIELLATIGKVVFVSGEAGQFWKLVGLAIATGVESVNMLFAGMTAVLNVTAKFSELVSNPQNWLHFKDAAKEALDYSKQQVEELNDKLDAGAKRLYTLANGHPLDQKGATDRFVDWMRSPENQTPQGSKTTPDTAPQKFDDKPLNLLKTQYQDAGDASKAQYQKDVDQTNELVKARKLGVQEADKANADAAQREYQRQVALIELYRQKADAMVHGKTGANPEAVASFQETLNTRSTTLKGQEDHRVSEEAAKAIAANLAAQDKADQEAIASTERLTAAKIAEFKKQQQAGQITAEQMLDYERTWLEKAQVAIDQHYEAEIKRAGADADRVAALTAQKEQADARYTAQFAENSSARTEALLREYEAAFNKHLEEEKTKEKKVVDANSRAGNSHNLGVRAAAIEKVANAELLYAQAVLKAANAEIVRAQALGISGPAMERLVKAQEVAQQQLNQASQKKSEAVRAQWDQSPVMSSLHDLGQDLQGVFGDATDGFKDFGKDFASSVQDMADSINVFHDGVNNIMQAFHSGGLLGGLGASSSTFGGIASSLSKAIGGALGNVLSVAGPIGSAIGGLFSSISSIFTQEAQNIAQSISREITNTMNALSDQTATMTQTLAALQQERQQAIDQLSGKKGGQDELNKLLPGLDQQIAQLKLQIAQTKLTFENSLQDLQLNNTALSSVFDKWQQINKQVQDYLSAGGSVAEANRMISDSLREMKKQAGDALNQGYQQAIQDALTLQNLIQQRMQMERQEAETEFGTINQDALERRGTKAIDVGTQLQQQRAQYDQQLQNINAQVDLTQQKVNLEGKIFDIAKSTAQLQETSNQLQIQQLQEQLQILQGQQAIYNGITQGSNGQYQMSNTLMNQIGVVNIIVQPGGTAGDNSAAAPQDYADAVSGVLTTWSRYGMGTSISRT